MPQLIKLTSNVAEFGLFRSVAKTRARLIIAALTATACTIGAGLWSADFIMERSTSVVLNIAIITLNMILVMLGAYLQSMMLGDIFFKGPWREQIILGERPWIDDPDAKVVVANHNAEFMIILIMLVIGNAMLVNYGAGGFIDRYHAEGFFRARQRSPDPEERVAALQAMADPTQFELWENPNLHELVTQTLGDPTPEVRAQAAWNAGKMKIMMAQKPMIALVTSPEQPALVRAQAAIALGRLGPDDNARAAIEAALASTKKEDKALAIGLLRGVGLLGDSKSFGAVKPWTSHEDEQIMIHALWAAHKTQSPEARTWLLAELDKKPKGTRQCALLDAMKMVSTSEDVDWARKRFIYSPKNVKCERVIWEDRDETQTTILFSDTLRTKYVKIVANSGDAHKHKAWFQRIVNDNAEDWPIRETTSAILRQLEKP